MSNLKSTITEDTWTWIISNEARKSYFVNYVADALNRRVAESGKACVSDVMYNAIFCTINNFASKNPDPWGWSYIRDNFSALGFARRYNKLVASR